METRTVTDSGVQVALDDDSLEGTTAKQMKKEPGITGKSVVVLRGRDVVVRNGIAFMPNTIEMAQLKKREKGQFKTNVQFCSKMTEADVKKLLMETFPYLENQRFYCAAAVDNRTRLDFHGQPRIWDGQFIKRKIKGNSALYILTYEQESGDGLGSKVPEQMTLKRSHDQITSPENEMFEQSLKTGTKRANTLNVLTGFEVAFRGSSILTGASAEGSQPKLPEKMSQMVPCIYVPVTGQHDSAVQSGAIPKARISTASNQQSLSKTADGSSNTWQAGLPLGVHKMPQEIHSVFTPDMNKLHISSRSPGQLQKTVNVEKTVLTRDQRAWTTEGRGSSEVRLPVTTTAQGDKSFELVKGAGTGFQQGARMVLSDLPSHATDDQPDSGFSDAEEKGASGNSAAKAAILSDSGLENTGAPSTNPNTCIQDQNYSSETLPLDWIDTFLHETPQIATDPNLCQIPAGAVITGAENGISSKGVVQNPRIVPSSSGMEGGVEFHIAFPEPLAQQVTSGQALFKGVAFAPLRKYSQCDLAGIVPPSTKPGIFDVTVFDQTGNYLGMTKFSYTSPAPAPLETVQQALRDENLGTLFLMLAQKFGSLQVSAGDNNAAQGSGLLNMQDQGQTQQQQSLQLLQLLVYTAAETGAQEFIEIIYSTSAGRTVFYSYKDKTPLPEDVARANGHTYLAQYLQDVNTRLSKEVGIEAQSNAIDWLELVKAVQTQASAVQVKSVKEEKHPSESDDNSSDYFADSETSSNGSLGLDEANQPDSDSDSDSSIDKELCNIAGWYNEEPNKRPDTCARQEGPSCETPEVEKSPNREDSGAPLLDNKDRTPFEKEKPAADSNEEKDYAVGRGFINSLSQWFSTTRKKRKDETKSATIRRSNGATFFWGPFDKGDTSGQANVHSAENSQESAGKGHLSSQRRTAPDFKYSRIIMAGVVLVVLVVLLVLAGIMQGIGPSRLSPPKKSPPPVLTFPLPSYTISSLLGLPPRALPSSTETQPSPTSRVTPSVASPFSDRVLIFVHGLISVDGLFVFLAPVLVFMVHLLFRASIDTGKKKMDGGIEAIGKSEKERECPDLSNFINISGEGTKVTSRTFCRTLEDPLEHNEWEKKLTTKLF